MVRVGLASPHIVSTLLLKTRPTRRHHCRHTAIERAADAADVHVAEQMFHLERERVNDGAYLLRGRMCPRLERIPITQCDRYVYS